MFGKAKRFNPSENCAPAPGHYNPLDQEKAPAALVGSVDRFKIPKDVVCGALMDCSTASVISNITPRKAINFSKPELKDNVKPALGKKPLSADATKIREMEAELRRLMAAALEAERRLKQREEEVARLEGRLQQTLKDKSALQAGTAALDKQVADLNKANAILKNKMQVSEGLSEKQHQLQQQLADLTEQAKRQDKEKTGLVQKIDKHEKEKLSLKQRLDALGKEKCDVQKKLECLENEKTQLTNKLKVVEGEKTDLSRHVEEKSGEREDVLKQLDVQSAENSALRFKLDTLGDDTALVNKKYEAVVEERESLVGKLSTIEEDKKLLMLKIEHQDIEKSTLMGKIDVLENANGSLQEQLKVFEEENCVLDKEIKEVRKEKESLVEKLEEIDKQKGDLTAQLAAMDKEKLDLVAEIRSLGRDRATLTQRLEQQEVMLRAVDGLTENIAVTTECHDTLAEYKDALVREVTNLKTTVRDMNMQKMDDDDLIRHLKGEVFAVTDRILLDQEALEETQKTMHNLTNQIHFLQVRDEQLNNNVKNMSQKYEQLEENLYGVETESREREQRLSGELKGLRDNCYKLQTELEKLTSANADLIKKLALSQEERERGEQRLGRLGAEIQDVRAALDQAYRDRDTLAMDHAQVTLALTQQTEASDGKIQSLENSLDDLNLVVENKDADIEQLQIELTQKISAIESLKMEITHKESSLRELESETSSQVGKIPELEARVGELQQESEEQCSVTEALRHNIELLEKEVDTRTSLCNDLEDNLQDKQQEVSAALAATDVSQAEIQKLRKEVALLQVSIEDGKMAVEEATHIKDLVAEEHEQLLNQLFAEQSTVNQKVDEISELKTQLSEQEVLSSRCVELQTSVQTLNEKLSSSEAQVVTLTGRVQQSEVIEEKLKHTEDILKQQTAALHRQQQEVISLRERTAFFAATEDELACTRQTLEQLQKSLDNQQSQHDESMVRLEIEYRTQMSHTSATLSEEQQQQIHHEVAHWRNLYESLQERIKPFQEQLEAFEAERQALLGASHNAQQEIDKLSHDYARLLGHQNQKQKIHHILKLKEENNNLKQDLTKAREQVTRMHRAGRGCESRIRMDPSKSFIHKENTTPTRSPLRDGNR